MAISKRAAIKGCRRHTIDTVVALAALWLLLASSAAWSGGETEHQISARTAIAAGLLDGMVFRGPTGTKDMDAHHEDVAVFANGMFHSIACDELGFTAQRYEAQRDGDAIRFTVVTVSPRHGILSWQGVVRGGRLEANYVWTKKGWLWTTQREYWLKAEVAR